MSEELARYTPNGGGLITEAYIKERRDVIAGFIGSSLTDAELDVFAAACVRYSLDPLRRQIYALKYKKWNPDTRQNTETMNILIGIDGYRAIAIRTGEYVGMEGPYWCGPDGEWKDVWLKEEPPAACKVYIWRAGFQKPVCGVTLWREKAPKFFDKTSGEEKISGLWAKMPASQLAKCAEALALRMAFPTEFAGTYVKDEMDQAQAEVVEVQAEVVQAKPIARPVPTKPVPAAASKLAEMKAILGELERLAPDDYDNIRQAALKAKDNAEDFEDVLKGARRLLQTLKDAADELPM